MDRHGNPKNDAEQERYYLRFPLSYRIQHIVLIFAFITLILTGLPLLFPESEILRSIIFIPAIFVLRGTLHRIAATVLVLLGIYHILFVIFSAQGNRDAREIIPRAGDIRMAVRSLLYNFGIAKHPPKYGRFRFIEKFQYLAVVFATLIMIITGGVLWFEEISMMLLPKWVMDITITVHGLEAIVVFLALIVWHIYTVHFSAENFPMSNVWLDGKISESKIKKLHPLEYEKIKDAEKYPPQ
ncbi:MAG: cytochrome b/b6 domain-containing protein, partial [bacterium]